MNVIRNFPSGRPIVAGRDEMQKFSDRGDSSNSFRSSPSVPSSRGSRHVSLLCPSSLLPIEWLSEAFGLVQEAVVALPIVFDPSVHPPLSAGEVPRGLPAMEYQYQLVQNTLQNRIARKNDPTLQLYPKTTPNALHFTYRPSSTPGRVLACQTSVSPPWPCLRHSLSSPRKLLTS